MNSTKGKPYRILVAIIFGMAGFVINFLDLQLLESPEFKISILAGLYFPLVIALAWGWRYGLLSALAGGCQSMWWLWRNDGWGFFYAVPVFSLWILWHGWWAERRGKNHPWHQSCFAVEIPFRIAIELGFYTIFRWLVSFNPPPWNPAITWDYVPMSWVHTVVIKHAITAYILLLAAYVTVNVGPVRRFFGLQPKIEQRDTNAIYAAAVLIGLVFWVVDSVADYLIFNPSGQTFWEVTVLETDPHNIFMRSLYMIVSMVGAVFIVHIVRQRSMLNDRLIHLNKVLRAIRNVNQLITREKDQALLIQGACENLVKNRGYNSAWIALMDDAGKCTQTADAGLGEKFLKLSGDLKKGNLPVCAQKALAQSGGVVIENPHLVCSDCPLASSYEMHVPLSIRLEYQGKTYGVLSTSMPRDLSWDYEELELFEELGEDIAFALYSIEREQERKKAEEVLHETESLYRLYFDNVSDIICSIDPESKILSISSSVENMLGYKPKELIGRPFKELNVVAPEDLEQAVSNFVRALGGERIPSVEYQFIARDGTKKWGELSGAPLTKGGEVMAVVSVIRDITERKEAEEAQRESESQYRGIFNSAIDSFLIFDLEGNIVEANPQACKMYGYTYDELIKLSGKDIVHPEYHHLFEQFKNDVQSMGEFYAESIDVRKDGVIFNIEVKGSMFVYKGKPHLLAVIRDITERKEAEEALREAYAIINKSSSVAFNWKNQEGWPVEFVSENVEKLFGYTAKEFTTGEVNYAGCIHPEDLERVANEVAEFSSKKGTKEFTHEPYRIIAKDGSEKIVNDWTYIVRDNDGHITHYKGIIEDISEQKRAEEEHEKLQIQLAQSQKMEAIGTLAGGVAHDFNNLLTSIIGNADFALMQLAKDNPLHEVMGEIKKAGEKSASLTHQLLAFSRKQAIKPIVLDLNHMIQDTEKMLKRLIGEDIELSTILEPELGKVNADPGQIDQVIMNLSVNARDAMTQGGRLTIETKNVELDEEYFRTRGVEPKPGSYVMLVVSDTGIGMDKETQSHIFDPFFTTKKKDEGTGLGLSTVYGIIKQSGGFIWAYSEPGHGTTFKIYLPRVEGDTELRKKEQAPVKELSGSETILIAEDDAAVRALATKILQRYGYRVLQAGEGQEALKVMQEHEGTIHLILTDVIMPKMSGRELVEMIQPMHPEIKVIYMSGYTDDAIDRHGVLAPDVEFLQKPFMPKELVRRVREVLGG